MLDAYRWPPTKLPTWSSSESLAGSSGSSTNASQGFASEFCVLVVVVGERTLFETSLVVVGCAFELLENVCGVEEATCVSQRAVVVVGFV